jgi:hypothetical protein
LASAELSRPELQAAFAFFDSPDLH